MRTGVADALEPEALAREAAASGCGLRVAPKIGVPSPAMVKIIASVAIAFVNDTNLPDTCAILPTPRVR
jgi:hypothetical protein